MLKKVVLLGVVFAVAFLISSQTAIFGELYPPEILTMSSSVDPINIHKTEVVTSTLSCTVSWPPDIGPGPYPYSWSKTAGPGTLAGATSASPTLTVPADAEETNITVSLTITNDWGEQDTQTMTITVNKKKPVINSVTISPDEIPLTGPTTDGSLTADVSENDSLDDIEWEVEEAGVSLTNENTLNASFSVGDDAEGKEYDVTLTVENNYGYTDEKTETLIVAEITELEQQDIDGGGGGDDEDDDSDDASPVLSSLRVESAPMPNTYNATIGQLLIPLAWNRQFQVVNIGAIVSPPEETNSSDSDGGDGDEDAPGLQLPADGSLEGDVKADQKGLYLVTSACGEDIILSQTVLVGSFFDLLFGGGQEDEGLQDGAHMIATLTPQQIQGWPDWEGYYLGGNLFQIILNLLFGTNQDVQYLTDPESVKDVLYRIPEISFTGVFGLGSNQVSFRLPEGEFTIQAGVDENTDGVLGADEVSKTIYFSHVKIEGGLKEVTPSGPIELESTFDLSSYDVQQNASLQVKDYEDRLSSSQPVTVKWVNSMTAVAGDQLQFRVHYANMPPGTITPQTVLLTGEADEALGHLVNQFNGDLDFAWTGATEESDEATKTTAEREFIKEGNVSISYSGNWKVEGYELFDGSEETEIEVIVEGLDEINGLDYAWDWNEGSNDDASDADKDGTDEDDDDTDAEGQTPAQTYGIPPYPFTKAQYTVNLNASRNGKLTFNSKGTIGINEVCLVSGEGTGAFDQNIFDGLMFETQKEYLSMGYRINPMPRPSMSNNGRKILPFYNIMYMVGHGIASSGDDSGVITDLVLDYTQRMREAHPAPDGSFRKYKFVHLSGCSVGKDIDSWKTAFNAECILAWDGLTVGQLLWYFDNYFYNSLSAGMSINSAQFRAYMMTRTFHLPGVVPVLRGNFNMILKKGNP